MMYSLLRPFLFKLEAEKAHHFVLKALHLLPGWCFAKPKSLPTNALGYAFAHPLGLAAGLDKNGEHIDALAKLGFSFIEVGTVTPRPQQGNAKPRLFRLPDAQALINRMGFNNHGVQALAANVRKARFKGILGINIGKNKDTSLNHALDDYLYCLRTVYSLGSYITINVSSPNTPDLRQLQLHDYFCHLILRLREEQQRLADEHQKRTPLVVKISPDESDENLKRMAHVIAEHGIEGIIATNTTCERMGVSHLKFGNEAGGLSGRPLANRSTECLKILKSVVGHDVTLIGSGGVDNPITAQEKLKAGASLLQVYTGLIYEGPGLIKQLVNDL